MQPRLLTTCVVAALALAACGNDDRPKTAPASGGSTATAPAPAQPQANTPTTPANAGQPSAEEKREGANPVQGQVDPKQSEQRKDFQQRGDGAGPTSAETKPAN